MKYNLRHAAKVRWRALRKRCPECGGRGYTSEIPWWDEDPVVISFGWWAKPDQCPCCGRNQRTHR